MVKSRLLPEIVAICVSRQRNVALDFALQVGYLALVIGIFIPIVAATGHQCATINNEELSVIPADTRQHLCIQAFDEFVIRESGKRFLDLRLFCFRHERVIRDQFCDILHHCSHNLYECLEIAVLSLDPNGVSP
jgi:hypothetical protein